MIDPASSHLSISDLSAYLDDLLSCELFRDYAANGIQVASTAAAADGATIQRLMTSPTASLAACTAAANAQADCLLVHHGLIWGKIARIDGLLRPRLKTLLMADCALLAYHLPLDAHPQVGNNAWVLDQLGVAERHSFGEQNLGLWGSLSASLSPAELSARCRDIFDHDVIHSPGADKPLQRIGVVSGGGHGFLLDAAAAGLDALITGESSEQTWHEAAESGTHCFSCGHYATERFAIHALGAALATQFNFTHLTFDDDNIL